MEMNQKSHKATAEKSDKFLFLFLPLYLSPFVRRFCHLLITGTTCNSNFIERHIPMPYNNAQRYYTTESDKDYKR